MFSSINFNTGTFKRIPKSFTDVSALISPESRPGEKSARREVTSLIVYPILN